MFIVGKNGGQILQNIRDIYSGVTAKMRFGISGECTDDILIARGVRQDCVLTPFLFSLYINNLRGELEEGSQEMPQIGHSPILALLYADDAVIMVRTPKAMQILINNYV